jgi:predicted O-linked N-acetylglucosamine transferase (SPINDLY family)
MSQADLKVVFEAARKNHQAGRLGEAEALYRRILQIAPHHPQTLHLLGVIAYQSGRYEQAVQLIQQAIDQKPGVASFYNNLGNALKETGRLEEAEKDYRQALEIKPDYAGALANLAGLLFKQGQHQAAQEAYRKALELSPQMIEAHIGLGNTWRAAGAAQQAEACYREALRIKRDATEAYFELGLLQRQQGNIDEAIHSFRAAMQLKPDYPAACNNLGAALQMKGLVDQAIVCFQRVLSHQPEQAEAHFNLGLALESKGELAEAMAHLQHALAQEPDNSTQVFCHLTHIRLQLADWRDYEAHLRELIERIEAHLEHHERVSLPPLTLNALPLPTSMRAAVARQQASVIAELAEETKTRCAFIHLRQEPEKLKIGYVSPDFRTHPVGLLTQQMYAQHNRDQFEVFCYSLVDVQDETNQQIRKGCDRYVDISSLATEQAARRIYADGIHILIDLAGHTTYSRPAIFALKPAPIQAHYLGYLDTMGASFLPYMIADQYVITEELAAQFSEAIVYLPDSFLVASPLPFTEKTNSQIEVGLPERGFVFCCFNQFYKIDPTVFTAWMRILQQAPGSILWLVEGESNQGEDNLRREARLKGVDPARLVFTRRLAIPEYLACHQLADLFLDTFVYNAGFTAAAALWSGLPVLTRTGQTFLSRMGSSLCSAASLPELICPSTEKYIERAVHLAANPGELAALRQRLVSQRDTLPLFDLPRFVGHLETAYRMMWADYMAGVEPRPVHVPSAYFG